MTDYQCVGGRFNGSESLSVQTLHKIKRNHQLTISYIPLEYGLCPLYAFGIWSLHLIRLWNMVFVYYVPLQYGLCTHHTTAGELSQ
jgi:hypothetical protein